MNTSIITTAQKGIIAHHPLDMNTKIITVTQGEPRKPALPITISENMSHNSTVNIQIEIKTDQTHCRGRTTTS